MARTLSLVRDAAARRVTVLIAGGGVAGAAAACLLGSEAMLFEREAEPHDKVCGEFVSWEAQDVLEQLGLDLPALGGVPIEAVRLVHGSRVAHCKLPRAGLGLSRRVLDEALLRLAVERGARMVRGRAVQHLVPGGLVVEGMGELRGRVLLATGKHALRGVRRGGSTDLVGFKIYFKLAPAQDRVLAGHVEVVLFAGGYAGLQHVEGGRANLCLLVRRRVLAEAGGGWPGLLRELLQRAPHLAGRLGGAVPLLERPLSIAGLPYGFIHAAGEPARLGDQMAVIPSFSGDGMAIALHTALAAAGSGDSAAFHTRMRAELGGQVGRAMVVHRLGLACPGLLAGAARTWPRALATVARLTRVGR